MVSHLLLGSPDHHADMRRCFPGGWRQCTGKALRCRAKQGRREDGADVWILNSIVVRFLGRFRERKESLVTMVALCYFIIARFTVCQLQGWGLVRLSLLSPKSFVLRRCSNFYFSRPHKLFRRPVFASSWSWLERITAPSCCPGFGKKRR